MTSPRPLASRVFLFSFPPMCLAVLSGFLAINALIRAKIKEGLKDSLHRAEAVMGKTDAQHSRRSNQLIAILSENAGLKAAMGLLREISLDREALPQARLTVQAQLQELGGMLEYDLLLVADPDGSPVAALVEGKPGELEMSRGPGGSVPRFVRVRERLYETATVPINLGVENLGNLTVGRKFEFGSLDDVGYAALFDGRELMVTSFPSRSAIDSQLLAQCGAVPDGCELNLDGLTYLTFEVRRASLGEHYRLLSFQPVDAAMLQFTKGFKTTFLLIGACGVLAVLLLSIIVSRSVSRPLTALVAHLRDGEKTGELLPDFHTQSSTCEVNRLAEEFNRAAKAIRDSQYSLEVACLQFVETMAQVLDARDAYTAGHSNRVSAYSVAIANAMGLPSRQIEIINIGAKLHDIGKIGIPDAVLQKPGRLTPEEFELIKQHPQIGKRILERVGRFESYLSIVELHHENHDGTGYPFGLKDERIPLEARIVHVADVYDAITSNRSYRNAMPISQVLDIFESGAGTQFDPAVVEVFLSLLHQQEVSCEESLATA